jgi:hypothetical protein
VPLAAEANDGYDLPVQKTQIGVFFVQHIYSLPPCPGASRQGNTT